MLIEPGFDREQRHGVGRQKGTITFRFGQIEAAEQGIEPFMGNRGARPQCAVPGRHPNTRAKIVSTCFR